MVQLLYVFIFVGSFCNVASTTVNAGYSAWSEYGACSKSCDLGVSTRERTCTSPEPIGKGAEDCTKLGAHTETRYCMVKKCKSVINGGYSTWSRFSQCSATCDDGVKTRTRTCTNPIPKGATSKDCLSLGAATETIRCNEGECPPVITCKYESGDGTGGGEVYGGMGRTAEECISICFNKRRVYADINGVTIPKSGNKWCYCERGMTGRKNIPGYESCFMLLPVDGKYSAWTDWTSCSQTCNSGLQKRSRICTKPEHGGKPCSGPSSESRSCNTMTCPEYSCEFVSGEGTGESHWSIGRRISVVECVLDCVERRKYKPDINGVSVPTSGDVTCHCEKGMTNRTSSSSWKSCFLLFPVDGELSEWSNWSTCTKSCESGSQDRRRTCTPPVRGGKKCDGETSQKRRCNTARCPDFKCDFLTGDGRAQNEIYAGVQNSDVECILTCHNRRATYPDINGVSIPTSGDISCYCKRGMYNRTLSKSWKSCEMLIPIDGYFSDWSKWSSCTESCNGGKKERKRKCTEPVRGGTPCRGKTVESRSCNSMKCPDFECHFADGDGTGGSELFAGKKKNVVDCLLTCNERRAMYPDINGVSVPSSGEINCYCKRGMRNRTSSHLWRSCFMLVPVDGFFSTWSKWTKCTKSCDGGLQERTRTCTPPIRGGRACSGPTKQSSPCNTIQCPPYECEFKLGDGTGEDIYAGTQRSVVDCIWACDRRRVTFPDINGVAVPTSGRINCYCKRGMKSRTHSVTWKSCIMLVPIDGRFKDWSSWSSCSKSCNGGIQKRKRNCTEPIRGGRPCQGPKMQSQACNTLRCPPFPCEMKTGDGNGYDKMYLGIKSSVVECIMACAQEATVFPNINGVTVPSYGNVDCYCDRGMKKITPSASWNSCFMLLPVNGKYSEWSGWSKCSKSCGGGDMKRARKCDSPAPLRGGKPCHGLPVESKSCNTMKCPRYSCDFATGDGIGGSDEFAGSFNTVVECLVACEEKASMYLDINGISIPTSGDISCYCKRGMKARNGKGSWKSCFARIPVDGKYSDWSHWSKCTRSCGSGTQERTRTCREPIRGGLPCKGDRIESQKCNKVTCPGGIPCKFGDGEGVGDDEIDVGPKNSAEECIKECRKKRTEYPKINGVSMTSSKPLQCLCEINMKTRVPVFNWRSCIIYK